MKTPTLKELADIGAKTSLHAQGRRLYGGLCVNQKLSAYDADEPFRQAFARAVKDAVEKPLLERINELEVATAPPTADGKTPGQVMCEVGCRGVIWETTPKTLKDQHEKAASAVLAAFGQDSLEAGIKRMEAVPWNELPGEVLTAESIRARLISAAREGQPSQAEYHMPKIPNPLQIAEPVLIPLDASDIRATDEFRPCGDVFQVCTLRHADEEYVSIFRACVCENLTYKNLAYNYLRRQHGSTEWKPCTKEKP
jgi:hypothetical protein